jgi:Tfp pilus assembly ATPase PilU
MMLLDDHLFQLFKGGKVSFDEIIARANDPENLEIKIRQFRNEMKARKGG